MFSLPHPLGDCVGIDPEPDDSLPLARPYLARSYFDDDTSTGAHSHRIGEVFVALGRAGFQVDTILEPEPPGGSRGRALVPTTVIFRARKVGS